MKLFDWLKPGLKIKRWLFLGSVGIAFLIIGGYAFINKMFLNNHFLDYYPVVLLLGIVLIAVSLKKGAASIVNLLDTPGSLVKCKIDKKLYEKRILNKGPKTVVIGGGTGLSVLLRGLKKYTSNITAIVTVADDGGGSGILREDLGMLPPGDIRNCILALADTEPIMEKLLQYRFEEGKLKGQSFGNLLIAAMNGISDNFEEAIKKINHVLAVTGKVLPVTVEEITLYAKLKNGKVIKGESQIPIKVKEFDSGIDQVFIKPNNVVPLEESIEEIMSADVIILGPGSLYTSIIPNLLVEDIRKAIRDSIATKIYITNVMTQPGETDGYSVLEHVEAIIEYLKSGNIDYVFVNDEKIPKEVLKKYAHDGAQPIRLTKKDCKILKEKDISVIEGPFVDIKKQYIRHDANKLSEMITKLVLEEKYAIDKKKIIDYYILSEELKKV
ncbi:gluconeogenesis factor YvcK family protein [Crassaminicella profunda]|uniref:gluconeogenesis factor YvcK family protein n=1 Tax=Crassaminicella profunda TaxID=1286698 RepID=UPI001CA620CD|nr:YvcK family protein [Crassaminicella profunda]QZY56025.1 YvcK family protein [Crassaminicella profunda]